MNIAQCLSLSSQLENVSDSARLDAEILLANCLRKDRAWLYTWPEFSVDEEQVASYTGLLDRRAKGEPIAYILKKKSFWSLDLKVSNDTLIPRPDTELLVELALQNIDNQQASILDLGTGTGAIALAIARERPACQVFGVDRQSNIVALAKENAELHGLKNVTFSCSDWFADISDQKFNLIVSNPPYIARNDPWLSQGDVRFEPSSALVSGEDGLVDLRHIVRNAQKYLLPGGYLAVEHGWQQKAAVCELFRESRFGKIQSHPDLAGNDRVVIGIC